MEYYRMIIDSLNLLNTDWKNILKNILKKFPKIKEELNNEKEKFTIYPPQNLIFNCFNYFNFKDLNVVIIGQDPYHQLNQANGLCFSVSDNIKIPPSLNNIFKEIYNDRNIKIKNGNLEYLAQQGVLLLNTTLTVRDSEPNSHLKIWKGFVNEIISYIINNSDRVVFLLWGSNAKKIIKNDLSNHLILRANHPSPLSANRGGWFNNNHFELTNEYLINNGKKRIEFKK